MKRVLSIDQSSRVTGYAIFDNKNLVTFGHFSIPANKTMGQRLESFFNHLKDLLEKYNIQTLYFEGIQYQNNAETFKKLAMIQGIVFYCSQVLKISSKELTPSHWRKILKEKNKISFGRARAEQKENAQKFVKEYFNKEATEDECDAICLGLAALYEEDSLKSAF